MSGGGTAEWVVGAGVGETTSEMAAESLASSNGNDEVCEGEAKSSDKASRRKSSLKGCKNQEMYQKIPPHLSPLQNDVTVHMLINSLKRKQCSS